MSEAASAASFVTGERNKNVRQKIRNKMKKMSCILGAFVLVLAAVCAFPTVQAHAEEIYPGEYSVTVVPTYQNPDTGVIDDVGQNPGIGNMMVKAQVQSVGYVEIEDDGTIWLNTRWNQADANIYAKFETSSDGSQTWTQRDFQVTNQAAVGNYEFAGNTFSATVTDYRFQLGSLNDTIRCTNYVEAMDRECVWFCYITDLTSGVGESWTTITPPNMSDYTNTLSSSSDGSVSGEIGATDGSSSSSSSASSSTSTKTPIVASGTTGTDANAATGVTDGIKDRTVADAKTADTSGTSITSSGEGLSGSTGIVGMNDTDSDTKDSGSTTSSGITNTTAVVLAAILGAVAGAVVIFLVLHCIGKKKRQYVDLFADVDENAPVDAPTSAPANVPEETAGAENKFVDETEILKESMEKYAEEEGKKEGK